MNTSTTTFLATISLLTIAAISATTYTFLINKDYDFIVEAPCDPAQEMCFSRDCSGGECPPNELEHYRIFTVSAEDFQRCTDDSCLQECTNQTIACTELVCGESEDDECAE